MDVILGDSDRLHAVAQDFIHHYETSVVEGATVVGKSMFVCANRYIAYKFYKPAYGDASRMGSQEDMSG